LIAESSITEQNTATNPTAPMSREQFSAGFDQRTGNVRSAGESAAWVLFLFSAAGGFNVVLTDQLEKAAWLVADIAAVAAALCAIGPYAARVRQLWLLFSWPFVALVSTIWSLSPGLTAYHAAQLFMTMLVGLVMHERLGLYRLIVLLFIAITIGVLASVAVATLGLPFAISVRGEWSGIFQHKNVLGLAAALLIYTGLLLVRRYWLLVLPVLAVAATALVHARSATSLIALCAVVAVLPIALTLRLRFYYFAAAASFLAAVAALGAGWALVDNTSLAGELLSTVGRDDTLTGRSELWDFGWQEFLAHPILGLGYKAYWISDTSSAAYVRYFVRQDLWYFHNNVLEVAVATGVVGVAVFLAGLLQVVVLVVKANVRTPGILATWSLMFLTHVLILCAVENPLFYNHSLSQILLVMIAVAAVKLEDRTDRRTARPLPLLTSAHPFGTVARAPHW
jgi:exopolysaccharide production protein ExoQ